MNYFYAFCVNMHSRVINKVSDRLKLATVAVYPASSSTKRICLP